MSITYRMASLRVNEWPFSHDSVAERMREISAYSHMSWSGEKTVSNSGPPDWEQTGTQNIILSHTLIQQRYFILLNPNAHLAALY